VRYSFPPKKKQEPREERVGNGKRRWWQPRDEAPRAAVKVARQVDHYRRVRCQARRMPELAAVVGGEDALVDLIYGDIDEFGRVLEGAPITPGVYATYVPN